MSRDARKRLVGAAVFGALGVVLAALLVAGCGASRPKPQDFDKALDTDTVTMLDSKVTSQVARQKEWTERVNGFLKLHLVLRNLSGNNLKIEIKTAFKDENGAAIDHPNLTWEPVTINPHEDYHYSKLCPSTSGSDYHVYVRIGSETH
jgi:uncharacterized protein YcfL